MGKESKQDFCLDDVRLFEKITEVKRIGKEVDSILKVLNGNGKPGLKSRIDLLESNLNSMMKTNEDNGKKIDALIISMQKITDFTHFMFILAGIVGFTLGIAIAYFKP